MPAGDPLIVLPEVDAALRAGHPVVALETAVLTHGLPRAPLHGGALPGVQGWNALGPVNVECVRAMERAVRAEGATPAVVAVVDGALRIGLDEAALAALGANERALKVAAGSLAHALATGASAGTTVSATLIACGRVEPAPIRVFATGGIGGVHAGWTDRPDVSADLPELGRSPVCVVCSGAKSILDVPATLEALETLGVPVVGYGTDWFPRFLVPGTEELPAPLRADDPAAVAALCRAHWGTLGRSAAVLVTQPVPPAAALDAAMLDAATAAAEREAAAAGAIGPARTPFVLDAVARHTGGRSLHANIALLVSNAALAARIARSLPS